MTSQNQVVLITRTRSFQQARSSIDSGKTRGIYQFLESWATFSSRRFLAGRVYHRRVRLHLSLFLLFLPLFHRPASLGMLMSFFRNPSSLIRGTSRARFFVSERMSRLIDEWRTYTLSVVGRVAALGGGADMCPRCPEQRSAVSYYTLDTPIFRRIATNTLMTGRTREKGAAKPHTVSLIEEKNTISKIARSTCRMSNIEHRSRCKQLSLEGFVIIFNFANLYDYHENSVASSGLILSLINGAKYDVT